MRIAVTGSAGTIGTPLVAELRRRGHEVWGIDLQHHADDQSIRADVSDFRQIGDALGRIDPDLVYHLAAEFGRWNGEHYYEHVHRSNVMGTRNVLEVQRRLGFRLFFASSSEVYGEAQADFIREDYLDVYPQPALTNDYAISKRVNEMQCENFRARYGAQVMVGRFFNAYGPNEAYHRYRSVIALFTYNLLHGRPITVYENYHRVFMYVDDFVQTLSNVPEHFHDGVTVNIGGEEFVSVEKAARMLLDLTGADESLLHMEPQDSHNVVNKRPDISLARRLLHHDPRTTLEVGLPRTVEWMRRTYEIGG